MPLPVLGVDITLSLSGATFKPVEAKRKKWADRIKCALARGRLTSGEASKLAGALQWAGQKAFRKLGRALLRPIFRHAPHPLLCNMQVLLVPRHIRARHSLIHNELRLALEWWLQVLEMDIAEERRFEGSASSTGHLFTDARSTPPRVAAVLFMSVVLLRSQHACVSFPDGRDGKICHCDMEPPAHLMESFKSRKDNQIMGLEILSIALGEPLFLCRLATCALSLALQAYAASPITSQAATLSSGVTTRQLKPRRGVPRRGHSTTFAWSTASGYAPQSFAQSSL